MPRERLIGPPSDLQRQCGIDGCPLLPGCGSRCFVHDRLAFEFCDEATYAIQRLDAIFRCAERMANAAPGDLIPTETRQALAQRCDGMTMPSGMTARQCALALRAWLLRQCRPASVGRPMTVAERMLAEGLQPIAELLQGGPA